MSDALTPRGWRVLVRPRWIAWHLFVIFAIAVMMLLGLWQFRRAVAGNSLSWAYTFEWPVFSVFAVVFWIKTIRDELRPPGQGKPEPEMWLPPGAEAPPPWELDEGARAPGGREAGPETGPAGPAGEAGPAAQKSEAELAEYNEYLARLSREVRSTHGKWHRSS